MISLIVPFKKGIIYLNDCLESIKAQKEKDIETILILDKDSEYIDRAGLLENYSDIGLRIMDNNRTPGVAGARNTGIENAKGQWIFFLDADDYLLEDTLTILKEKAKGYDFSYSQIRHTWFMKEAFNRDQIKVASDVNPGEKVGTLNEEYTKKDVDFFRYRVKRFHSLDEISILGILIKKDVLKDFRFNENLVYFSDLEMVTRLSMNDNEADAVEALYVKRHHSDSINLPALSQIDDERKYKDRLLAYKNSLEISDGRVKEFLEKNACDYFISTYAVLFHKDKSRITDENFKSMCELVSACSKKTIKKYHFLKGKILKNAIAKNKGGVEKNIKLRMAVKKLKMMVYPKHLYRTINLYVFSKLSVKDNWVCFESFSGRQYSGQPKYIYEYLRDNYPNKYKFIWLVSDKKVKVDGRAKRVKRFGLRYFYYTSRAKYWVLNSRQPALFKKKKGQILFETWHGTPLKKLFFDLDDVHGTNPNFKKVAYNQAKNWDYLLSDNPFSTEKLSSCFMYDKEKILELGYPANDPLYADDLKEKADIIKEKIGIPKDKKVILYAPTWRDDEFYEAGVYKYTPALDLSAMKESFGDEYVVLLRMHYWVVDKIDMTGLEDFVYNVSNYGDITDLYIVSDMCITDYSSVYFDYGNLRRPILFYMYDLEKYRDLLHGFYLDITTELPGPILRTNEELRDAIFNIEKVKEEYREDYQKFYDRFCCIDDGNAAGRICEKVFK